MTVTDSRKIAKSMSENPFLLLSFQIQMKIRNDIQKGVITTFDEYAERIGIKMKK